MLMILHACRDDNDIVELFDGKRPPYRCQSPADQSIVLSRSAIQFRWNASECIHDDERRERSFVLILLGMGLVSNLSYVYIVLLICATLSAFGIIVNS